MDSDDEDAAEGEEKEPNTAADSSAEMSNAQLGEASSSKPDDIKTEDLDSAPSSEAATKGITDSNESAEKHRTSAPPTPGKVSASGSAATSPRSKPIKSTQPKASPSVIAKINSQNKELIRKLISQGKHRPHGKGRAIDVNDLENMDSDDDDIEIVDDKPTQPSSILSHMTKIVLTDPELPSVIKREAKLRELRKLADIQNKLKREQEMAAAAAAAAEKKRKRELKMAKRRAEAKAKLAAMKESDDEDNEEEGQNKSDDDSKGIKEAEKYAETKDADSNVSKLFFI
jgi:acetolactate synthase small subunit